MTEMRGHDARDRSDQLSSNRALQDSTGSTRSQRIGNNGPLANPTVSFPEESSEDESPGGTRRPA
jgi:hypothetical protein